MILRRAANSLLCLFLHTAYHRPVTVTGFTFVPSSSSPATIHRVLLRRNVGLSIKSNGSSIRSYSRSSSSLYGFFGGDGGKKESIFSKALSKIKDKVSGSSKSDSQLVESSRDSQSAGGLINEMLKDAPFPVRMMGKMVAPIVSSMAESLGEQARQVQDLIEDARIMIVRDSRVVELLGEPVEVSTMPFQQSSSSVNINGQAKTTVQASFQVQGSRAGGVAIMSASGGEKASIEKLTVQAMGRSIDVDVSPSGSTWRSSPRSGLKSNDDMDIIDAEFVEKKTY